jgi:hypothetical protein
MQGQTTLAGAQVDTTGLVPRMPLGVGRDSEQQFDAPRNGSKTARVRLLFAPRMRAGHSEWVQWRCAGSAQA